MAITDLTVQRTLRTRDYVKYNARLMICFQRFCFCNLQTINFCISNPIVDVLKWSTWVVGPMPRCSDKLTLPTNQSMQQQQAHSQTSKQERDRDILQEEQQDRLRRKDERSISDIHKTAKEACTQKTQVMVRINGAGNQHVSLSKCR